MLLIPTATFLTHVFVVFTKECPYRGYSRYIPNHIPEGRYGVTEETNFQNELGVLQTELQPIITITNPRNNERLTFAKHTVQVVITQPEGVTFEISSVEFRYSYTDQYLKWSAWNLMPMESEGVYETFLTLDRAYFTENEVYSIEARYNNNAQTTSVNFYPDSSPESGLDLGTLNSPTEIVAQEEENFVKFTTTLSFTESHYVYDLPIPTQWITTLSNMSLITQYGSNDTNLNEFTIYQESDTWKLYLSFLQHPQLTTTTILFIYEEGVVVSNPSVDSIGTNDLYLSLAVSSTKRTWENVHIQYIEFPSDLLEQAWWAHDLADYQTWKVYDQDSKLLTTATISIKTTDGNPHAPILDITGLTISKGTTSLIIKGTTDKPAITEPGEETTTAQAFPVNIPALLVIIILPFAGYTFTIVRPRAIEGNKKKIMLIGLATIGIVFNIVLYLLEVDIINYVLLNLQALLLYGIVGLGAVTGVTMLEISGVKLGVAKQLVALIGFTALGLVFSRFGVPFFMSTIGTVLTFTFPDITLPKLTIPKITLPAITLPTNYLVLLSPIIFVVLLILVAHVIRQGFTKKQILNLSLAGLLAEVLLLILYVQGAIQLAISQLETSELMLINISLALGIGFAIVLTTVVIIKINKEGTLG